MVTRLLGGLYLKMLMKQGNHQSASYDDSPFCSTLRLDSLHASKKREKQRSGTRSGDNKSERKKSGRNRKHWHMRNTSCQQAAKVRHAMQSPHQTYKESISGQCYILSFSNITSPLFPSMSMLPLWLAMKAGSRWLQRDVADSLLQPLADSKKQRFLLM